MISAFGLNTIKNAQILRQKEESEKIYNCVNALECDSPW